MASATRKVLTRLKFDHQALRLLSLLGYDQKTVPAKDEAVYLRSTGNLSTGGTAVDVTDTIHPDNREMASARCPRHRPLTSPASIF